MNRFSFKVLFALFIFSTTAYAARLQVGTGFNSATGGRRVPSLNMAAGTDSFLVLFSSTGVATTAYYHSAYTLGGYWTRNAGEIAGGPVTTGFGIGGLYAERGFQDSGAALDKRTDYVVGPAFYSQWNFLGPVYISVEGIYGLVGPSSNYGDLTTLNARDHVNFIFGVQL